MQTVKVTNGTRRDGRIYVRLFNETIAHLFGDYNEANSQQGPGNRRLRYRLNIVATINEERLIFAKGPSDRKDTPKGWRRYAVHEKNGIFSFRISPGDFDDLVVAKGSHGDKRNLSVAVDGKNEFRVPVRLSYLGSAASASFDIPPLWLVRNREKVASKPVVQQSLPLAGKAGDTAQRPALEAQSPAMPPAVQFGGQISEPSRVGEATFCQRSVCQVSAPTDISRALMAEASRLAIAAGRNFMVSDGNIHID